MRDVLLSFRYRTDCMPFLLGVALYTLGKNDNSLLCIQAKSVWSLINDLGLAAEWLNDMVFRCQFQ